MEMDENVNTSLRFCTAVACRRYICVCCDKMQTEQQLQRGCVKEHEKCQIFHLIVQSHCNYNVLSDFLG